MDLRDVWLKKRSDRILGGIVAGLLSVIAWYNWIVAGLLLIVSAGVFLISKKSDLEQELVLTNYLDSVSASVSEASSYAMNNLPIGIAILDRQSHLVWGNSVFRDWVPTIEEGDQLQKMVSESQLQKLWGKSGYFSTHIDDGYYRVLHKFMSIPSRSEDAEDSEYMVLYFEDVTDSELMKRESDLARPVFAEMQVDNFTEVAGDLTEVERSELWAEVHTCILDELSQLDGFVKNYDKTSYVVCITKKSLDHLIECNFDILDKVRAIRTVNKIPITLSMGLSYGDGAFRDQLEQARGALDLALGRGGDQAVVRTADENKTFGGKSKATEKNTRVRARVMGQAMHELVLQADRVLVMGHAREDYDALGAALGVSGMVRSANVPVHVVVSNQRETVEKMVNLVESDASMKGLLVTPEEAEGLVGAHTVLFIVDTHRPEMVAAPHLLSMVQHRVVIDHHRRSDTFIDSPMLTYLEPAASSASELVTELLQYFNEVVDLNEVEATSLYSGIVVDTKNFAVMTGVRTFDAASYLRRSGANTDLVRSLFSMEFETMMFRSQILASAERLVPDITFAVVPSGTDNAQIISAQIADMMVTIEDIHAAFTIYDGEQGLNVSARSDGAFNVQVVMEAIGGGGHQTVAGAQCADMSLEEIKTQIVAAIALQRKEDEDESRTID